MYQLVNPEASNEVCELIKNPFNYSDMVTQYSCALYSYYEHCGLEPRNKNNLRAKLNKPDIKRDLLVELIKHEKEIPHCDNEFEWMIPTVP